MTGLLDGIGAPSIFDDDLKQQAIWDKGLAVLWFDQNQLRYDCDGNLMHRWSYGDRSSKFGWEYDHIVPRIFGGSDDLSNLRPRNWRGNASAGGRLNGLLGS